MVTTYYSRNRSKIREYKKKYREKVNIDAPWLKMLASARERAKKRGLEYNLTPEWAKEHWTGKCDITGIEFNKNWESKGPSPYSPSLDRIDPNKGYIIGNCGFVLYSVNAFKGNMTSRDDILTIARAIITGLT